MGIEARCMGMGLKHTLLCCCAVAKTKTGVRGRDGQVEVSAPPVRRGREAAVHGPLELGEVDLAVAAGVHHAHERVGLGVELARREPACVQDLRRLLEQRHDLLV